MKQTYTDKLFPYCLTKGTNFSIKVYRVYVNLLKYFPLLSIRYILSFILCKNATF